MPGKVLLQFLLLLCVVFVPVASGQEQKKQCELTSENFSLRGFKLGIFQPDFEKTYPKGSYKFTDTDKVTNIGFLITPLQRETVEQYKNVSAIRFKFFDNKLVAFRIDYDPSIKWESTPDFINTIKDSLSTPPSYDWMYNTTWSLFPVDFGSDAERFGYRKTDTAVLFSPSFRGDEASIVCKDMVLLVVLSTSASIEARIPNLQELIDMPKNKAAEEKKKQEEEKRKAFKP